MPLQNLNSLIHLADEPGPRELPIRHAAVGSPTRLAILLYLHNRPQGETSAGLADLLNLDTAIVRNALRDMSEDKRIACDFAGSRSKWYVPLSRDKDGSAQPPQ